MKAHARFLRSGPPPEKFAKLGAAMGPQDTQLVLGIGLEEVPNGAGARGQQGESRAVGGDGATFTGCRGSSWPT